MIDPRREDGAEFGVRRMRGEYGDNGGRPPDRGVELPRPPDANAASIETILLFLYIPHAALALHAIVITQKICFLNIIIILSMDHIPIAHSFTCF